MVYPYSHRTRESRSEIAVYKPYGSARESGGGVENHLGSMSTNSSLTWNLDYGQYAMTAYAWVEGNNVSAVEIKIKPYIDHAQSIVGKALSMFEMGSSTVVTVISIPISTVTNGKVLEIIPDAGSAGARLTGDHAIGPTTHGFKITVDVNANATTGATVGNLELEIVHQKQL